MSYRNEDGEPLMTDSQMRQECALDEQDSRDGHENREDEDKGFLTWREIGKIKVEPTAKLSD